MSASARFISRFITHDTDNIIHMEFSGLVRKDDLKIGKFFIIWGKQLRGDGFVKMTVNGQENTDFDNYLMKDGDKIEIFYQ